MQNPDADAFGLRVVHRLDESVPHVNRLPLVAVHAKVPVVAGPAPVQRRRHRVVDGIQGKLLKVAVDFGHVLS